MWIIFVICMCAAQTRDFWQKAFTIAHRRQNSVISQFKAQTLNDRVGSPGQKHPGGSGDGSKVQTQFHLCPVFLVKLICEYEQNHN